MAPKIRVAVCGSSLYMASIAGGLQMIPVLDVVYLGGRSPAFPQHLAEIAPAVIAFDLCETSAEMAAPVPQAQPGPLLVSVNQTTDEMLLSSGERVTVRTANDFLRLIGYRENGSAGQHCDSNP